MEVVVYKQSEFNEVLRGLRNSGGEAYTAYRKISEIRQSLEVDAAYPGRITDHGETRIKHAIKYKLNDSYRLITIQTGGVCFFLYAGKHDATDRWLDRHRGLTLTLNRKTNRLEIVYVGDYRQSLTPNTTPSDSSKLLLQQLSGINWNELVEGYALREAILSVKADTEDEKIFGIADDVRKQNTHLADCFLDLIDLLRREKLEDAKAREALFLGMATVITPEITLTEEVLSSPANADTIIRLGNLTPEQVALWEDPKKFQEWILFPHPDQRRVIDEDFNRPSVLSGVSGSGKTCALVHRAVRLARKYGERVLILTLNRSLARLIEILVERLPNANETQIETLAYYDYIAKLLEHFGLERLLQAYSNYLNMASSIDEFRSRFRVDRLGQLIEAREDHDIKNRWKQFDVGLNANPQLRDQKSRLEIYLYDQDQALDTSRYLYEEFDLIRSIFRNIDGYKGFYDYPREGRSITMQSNRREAILSLLASWGEFQIRNGFHDDLALTQAALLVIEDAGDVIPQHLRYRSVLIDEYQDFSTLDLQIIGRIPTDEENGLFLTGDLAQKIFPKDLNLVQAKLGPDRRVGRRINKNYRNTRQILEAATHLLDSFGGSNLARAAGIELLKPEYAEREGPRPFACKTDDQIAAAWAYAEERIRHGYVAFSVCIATADSERYSIDQILQQKPTHLKADRLTGDYFLNPEKVVVADIHDIKGFEFCLVIILGLDDGEFPSRGVPAMERWRDALRLYVAITRGRDEVRLFYSQKPSCFIEAMWGALSHIAVELRPAPATDDILLQSDEITQPPFRASPDSKDDSVERQTTTLNGYSVIGVQRPATQSILAQALDASIVQIANYCYEFDRFPTGATIIPDHIVIEIFKKYGAVPRFLESLYSTARIDRLETTRYFKTEHISGKCDFCHQQAIPGDSVCYACCAGD